MSVPKSQPMTKEEVMHLVNLVHANQIVFSKATNATNNQLKEAAWGKITDSFNCAVASSPRRPEQLRLKWENLKKAARKRSTKIRMNQFKTGGGKPEYMPPDEALDKVESMLGSTCSGFSVLLGGDREEVIEAESADTADEVVVRYVDEPEPAASQSEVPPTTLSPTPRASTSKFFFSSVGSKAKQSKESLNKEDIKARIRRNNAIAEFYELKRKKWS